MKKQATAKKNSGSSLRVKRQPASALLTTPLSKAQQRELAALAQKSDDEIDLSDVAEVLPPPGAIHVGRFYRPIKQLVSLRLDADVLAWFRSQGRGYQTYVNQVLRREMGVRAEN